MVAQMKEPSTETASIRSLPYCRYIERKENVGRAAIRNFLAKEAKYTWLLFIDSNMNVISHQYLANYLKEKESDVVYGGYQIKRDAETRERLKYNLRYIFECSRHAECGNHLQRQANPYADFPHLQLYREAKHPAETPIR